MRVLLLTDQRTEEREFSNVVATVLDLFVPKFIADRKNERRDSKKKDLVEYSPIVNVDFAVIFCPVRTNSLYLH